MNIIRDIKKSSFSLILNFKFLWFSWDDASCSFEQGDFSLPIQSSLHCQEETNPSFTNLLPVSIEIKYNAEGDLLFSASKDHVVNVWHSHNGERLGTYDGHNGTVWSIDADCKFELLFLYEFLLNMSLAFL